MEEILILNPKRSADLKKIKALQKGSFIVDELAGQLEELNQITGKKTKKFLWVYYPWRKTLVKILPEKEFQLVRTDRNRGLITSPEQARFRKIRVAFAGLNVGNPGAVCAALEGGANFMRLADIEGLSLTNLNRFRAGLPDLGVNKAFLTARQIWEVNPFAKLDILTGLLPGQEEKFLKNIDVLVEEIDYLPIKITLREQAKTMRVPVVMVTGNGPGLILDVERYDANAKLPILNGFLSKKYIEKVKGLNIKSLTANEKVVLVRDFMGGKFLSKRLHESFLLVGSKLAGIPQLAEASFLRGAVLAYAIRQIAVGAGLPSGRYLFSLDEIRRSKHA